MQLLFLTNFTFSHSWECYGDTIVSVPREKKNPPGPYIKFGEHLKSLRKASGKSWGTIERIANTSKSTISRDETGNSPNISLERLLAYAKAYHVPPGKLLRDWVKVRFNLDLESFPDPLEYTGEPELHKKLQRILESDTDIKPAIQGMIEACAKRIPNQHNDSRAADIPLEKVAEEKIEYNQPRDTRKSKRS